MTEAYEFRVKYGKEGGRLSGRWGEWQPWLPATPRSKTYVEDLERPGSKITINLGVSSILGIYKIQYRRVV